jgi:hypothetical protein
MMIRDSHLPPLTMRRPVTRAETARVRLTASDKACVAEMVREIEEHCEGLREAERAA